MKKILILFSCILIIATFFTSAVAISSDDILFEDNHQLSWDVMNCCSSVVADDEGYMLIRANSDCTLTWTNQRDFIIDDSCEYTVSSWLDYWIDIHKHNISRNTLNGYLVNIRHIKSCIGSTSLNLLSPLAVQNMYSNLLETLSGTSVLYVHRVLKMSLQYAVNNNVISSNPCNSVSVPRKNKFNATVLTDEQLSYLLKSIKGTELYLPVVLASLLGLRRGEILALDKSCLDTANKTLKISNSGKYLNGTLIIDTPKSKTSYRTLLLSDPLFDLLNSVKTDRFTYLTDGQLNKKFAKTLNSLNLPHIRFHDLRHTYATLMLKYGIPAKVVSERLGHSSIGITLDTYSHVLTSMQQPASSALDLFLSI